MFCKVYLLIVLIQQVVIQLFNQMMKIFRQKYIYNPEKPIFQSDKVKTYSCKNNETKSTNLIIIQHLQPPPFVQPSPGILQPIQIPTTAEPFSVYPITSCVSQVKRLSEPDAMYILKCLSQSKLKNPMYSVLSDQGIVCSDIEGILPNRSPSFQQLAISLLGLDENFVPKQNCVMSKWGLQICKSIKNKQNLAGSFQSYGWRDPKKASEIVTDPQFIIFKGRRKEESPFQQQYGLAFSLKHGICRFKYISLIKDGYEEHFYKQFSQVINYIQQKQKPQPFLKNIKFSKDSKGIKVFTDLANQGTLTEYITNKSQMGQTLTQRNSIAILDNFVQSMASFSQQFKTLGLGTMHIKCLYVNNNRICIGEPLLITDNIEKKLRNLKSSMDYFAPEMKQSIILYQNLKQQSKQKMDVWSFGFILHKFFTKQIPVFDPQKKPIINKTKISTAMNQLITKCLDEYPISRPTWKQMKLKEIQKKTIMIEEVRQQENQRELIRLGSKAEKNSEKPKSPNKNRRVVEELDEEEENRKNKEKQSEEDKLKQKQEEIDEKMPIPQQVSSKVRRVKLIIKTIVIMSLYIFVFFRPFIWSTIQIIQVRSNYASTTLHLVDNQNNRVSSVSILTSNALYFMTNDISFDDIQNKYQCIDETFDPIYNPSYSLLTYVQSPSFLALLLTGWLMTIVICVTKAISMWRGGISHRPENNRVRHWVSYGFYQLTLAALLFAHFYIYEFFYFAGATPCLSIANFQGLQPFFDSSLYLFLSNTSSYFQQVFSTLGILSIILLLSSCFHAWGPKQDQKYISSIASIIFRFVPFFLLFLICRIGVFMLFSPTAINDKTQLLPKILSGSFQGFIGIVPQIFIMICIVGEILIELLMYWCEKKTAESDRLARFFNIKKRKTTVDNDQSRIGNSNLDNSKMKLDGSSNQMY